MSHSSPDRSFPCRLTRRQFAAALVGGAAAIVLRPHQAAAYTTRPRQMHGANWTGDSDLTDYPPGARILRFPTEAAIGMVLVRRWEQPHRYPWTPEIYTFSILGEARGTMSVPAEREVALSVLGAGNVRTGVSLLAPGDVQRLGVTDQETAERFTDDHLIACTPLTGLVGFTLIGTQLTNYGVARLAAFRNMRTLHLAWNAGVTDDCLPNLTRLPVVQSYTGDLGATDAAYSQFGNWHNLRELASTGTGVTDAGMAPLRLCRALKSLAVPRGVTWRGLAKLEGLPLHRVVIGPNPNFDDAGLRQAIPVLKAMRQLQFIDLRGAPITDASVSQLGRLKHLRVMDVRDTQLSEQGVEYLRRLLP